MWNTIMGNEANSLAQTRTIYKGLLFWVLENLKQKINSLSVYTANWFIISDILSQIQHHTQYIYTEWN